MSNGFTCQRCHQPLILDPSLEKIPSGQKQALLDASRASVSSSSTSSNQRDFAQIPGPRSSKDAYLQAQQSLDDSPRARIGPAESFILLSQSQVGSAPHSKFSLDGSRDPVTAPGDISSTETVERLLYSLSSSTGIDHPLCSSCASVLQRILQDKLEDVQRERDAYISFEREWQAKKKAEKEAAPNDDIKSDAEIYTDLETKNKQLERNTHRLIEALKEEEEEERLLNAELLKVQQEEEELERQEIRFLQDRQLMQARATELASQLRTETTLHLLASQTLRKLESTNVYNDVFQIGHVPLGDSHTSHRPHGSHTGSAGDKWASAVSSGTSQTVGTINGLRLGGRPWVEWVEINAALGLVALCLHRISDKVGFTFDTYKIVPMGSFSRIEELHPSKNVYELYASTDLSAARLLQNRRFNYALVGMLDCLRQLIAYGRARKKGWASGGLDITKDKIAGHPIKLSANMGMSSLGIVGTVPGTSVVQSTEAEESWTKALRAVLAVLKRILIVESETDSVTDT